MDKREKTIIEKERIYFLFLIFIIFIFSFPFSYSQIYLGVAEGYVFYANGSVAENALVTISVRNCQAPQQYCIRQAYTQENGYYVIANLALEPYGYVDGTAEKGNLFAEGVAQADQYGVVELNFTLCEAPSSPLLEYISSFHPTNKTYTIIFSWISGTDPNNLSTYDSFYLDGVWENATSPVIRINLDFGDHFWGARTCNAYCCSKPNMSNFTIYNSIPPPPRLIDQGNTNNNSVLLFWQYVEDSDGDPVFYDFMIDSQLRQNVTSPQAVDGLAYGFHEWKVRACDWWQCSIWSIDTFYVQNLPCPKPNITKIENTLGYNNKNEIKFEWQSAKFDEEGDICHDEFVLNGKIIDTNATSPKFVSFNETQIIEWGVRSCDNKGACSEWERDSFIFCYGYEPFLQIIKKYKKYIESCVLRESIAIEGYQFITSYPKKVYQGEDFEIEIDFIPFEDLYDVLFLLDNKYENFFNFSQEVFVREKISKNSSVKILFKGKVNLDAKGEFDFPIKIISNNTLIVDRNIIIKVEEKPKISRLLKISECPFNICCILLLILLLILIFMIYKLLKIRSKKKENE